MPGDIVHIHPHEPPVDITRDSELKPGFKQGIKFLVDVNVGKLAKLLRMLGYDTAYHPEWKDKEIAEIACRENRVVLSKDKGLLKRGQILWGRLLRGKLPQEQFRETVSFFGLCKSENLFSRCLSCNTELVSVEKSQIIHLLEPKTKKYFEQFYRCPSCKKIFWPGSHYAKMREWLAVLD